MSKARDDKRRNMRREFAVHHRDGSPVGGHRCVTCSGDLRRDLSELISGYEFIPSK